MTAPKPPLAKMLCVLLLSAMCFAQKPLVVPVDKPGADWVQFRDSRGRLRFVVNASGRQFYVDDHGIWHEYIQPPPPPPSHEDLVALQKSIDALTEQVKRLKDGKIIECQPIHVTTNGAKP